MRVKHDPLYRTIHGPTVWELLPEVPAEEAKMAFIEGRGVY